VLWWPLNTNIAVLVKCLHSRLASRRNNEEFDLLTPVNISNLFSCSNYNLIFLAISKIMFRNLINAAGYA